MGMYREVSLNVVIEFDGFEKVVPLERHGCPKCKTENRTGYCSKCGMKTTSYIKDVTKDINTWWDIHDLFFYKDTDDELFDVDDYCTPTEGIIVSNRCNKDYNIEVSENTYTAIPETIKVDEMVEEFKEEHKDLIKFLDEKGMKPKVSFGCVYDYA